MSLSWNKYGDNFLMCVEQNAEQTYNMKKANTS
jgi:hypothetical protein